MMEFHRIAAAPLGHAAQFADILEHHGQRNHRRNRAGDAALTLLSDDGALAAQIADDVADDIRREQ